MIWTRSAHLHTGPRPCEAPQNEALHMTAPDHMLRPPEESLHRRGHPHMLRGIVIYALVTVLMRVSGKRAMGQFVTVRRGPRSCCL